MLAHAVRSAAQRSAAWSAYLRAQYRLLRWLDPLIRVWWRAFGLGITVELEISGRRTGKPRRLLVGLLTVRGAWYVGHPNGPTNWTLNLRDAGRARVHLRAASVDVRAEPLPAGEERDAAIFVTATQQPFPANLVYRVARRHILAVGDYFRLEPMEQREE